MKQNILFVITQFYKGGAEVNLLNIINQLDSSKFNVDFLIFDQVELKSSISLIPFLPEWINICDAAQNEGKIAFIKKAWFKVIRKITKRQLYRKSAYDFVKNKEYDYAFSYGEWMSPEFVALQVNAKRKSIWIHTDIDKAHYIDENVLFNYDSHYDDYIFVSNLSKKGAIEKYPFLRDRSSVIHNMLDDKSIIEKAKMPIDIEVNEDYILTVGNIRTEKNHLRQIEAMKILKDRNVNFKWLNIGSFFMPLLYQKVKSEIKNQGLEDDFLLLDADDNPYRYMKKAIAVGNFSNFESWSLVITEAKLLGVPVIATKTSGAREQIIDMENGILSDFTPEDIADKIEFFLKNKDFQVSARKSLENFETKNKTMDDFTKFLKKEKNHKINNFKKIIYLFDNVNYKSGAYKNTLLQIELLQNKYDIYIYSITDPEMSVRSELSNATFIKLEAKGDNKYMNTPFNVVMESKDFTFIQKLKKVFFAIFTRLGKAGKYLKKIHGEFLEKELENYDVVIVIGDASKLRETVASLKKPKKIQWIHTRYDQWREYSNWTRSVTKNDGKLYNEFDYIIVLSETCKEGFLNVHPHLQEKTFIIRNLFDVNSVLENRKKYPRYIFDPKKLNIITIGRIDKEKAFDRILKVAKKLAEEGQKFHWYIVGGGVLLSEIIGSHIQLGLSDHITFLGHRENPYPLLDASDVFALFSLYEGSPITIDESMILGKYVISTDVGGIKEQLNNYDPHKIVKNSETDIYENMKVLIQDKNSYQNITSNLDLEYFSNSNIINVEKLIHIIEK